MSREIKVSKYKGNTHYTVRVVDSYGQEHHIGYYKHIYTNKLEEKAMEIWSNETKPEVDLLDGAIRNCIELDKKMWSAFHSGEITI
jgi:hypothetical protein|tara:strand:+ start:37 stop:294 length:258 start_codon:yes stop_codon:yes gene_type:complete